MPRLARGIQYSRDSVLEPMGCGVLGRPVKPDDDTELVVQSVAPTATATSRSSGTEITTSPPSTATLILRRRALGLPGWMPVRISNSKPCQGQTMGSFVLWT